MGRRVLSGLSAALVAVALVASACSSGDSSGGGGDKTIRVAYQLFGTSDGVDRLMKRIKSDFEEETGYTLKLVPIQAAENDYYTKLGLMQRSPETAPDVLYEDTFLINSDVQAGYLRPLDDYLAEWDDWDRFYDAAKAAAQARDGKIYGIPMGTDTRGLWYNKEVFRKAGLPEQWEPKTWDDVLSAARTIKEKVPGVIPLNVYSGKPAGEGAMMQGFEMLPYGTDDTLYDADEDKWITSSPGFLDSLEFIKTIFSEGLAPSPQQALDPNWPNVVTTELLPQNKLGINLDGSWLPGAWIEGGANPWPEWDEVMGAAAMPTQNGQPPGATSMSGGWTLSVGSKSAHPDVAFKLIAIALNKENSLYFNKIGSQIAVRQDVAATDEYKSSNPTTGFFTDLVQYTHFRPAFPEYPQISNQIQVAMEAVMTGQASPEEAMQRYAEAVEGIVGSDRTATR
ncbi:MAG TPA: extracellular solute-binding protein [Actinomycetota bacterium]|nr:extracellular solute-binding protein [Actinomycetota bacterium]